jgi:hypothetical protein
MMRWRCRPEELLDVALERLGGAPATSGTWARDETVGGGSSGVATRDRGEL